MNGQKLKEHLINLKVSQSDLASRLGITHQAMNQALRAADIKTGFLEKICEVMDIDMSYFYPCKSTVQVTNKDNAHGNTATGNVTLQASNDVVAALIESNRLLAESTKSANEHLDKALEMLSQKK